MQSKKKSFIEALTGTIIGFIVTLAFSPLIYKICDVHIDYWQMGWATVMFTILSVIRGYIVRRYFNKEEIENNGTKENNNKSRRMPFRNGF